LNEIFSYRNFYIKGHPRFINQLSQGVDMISLVGEIITSSVNANMFTYEVAPVFNLMEESVLAHMRQYCGWSNNELSSKNGDGVLAPGGAVSNLYAVLAARHYAFPEIKKYGIRDGLRPAMIISKHVRMFEDSFCINCLLLSVIIQ
jgi:glutamate decarboxylase